MSAERALTEAVRAALAADAALAGLIGDRLFDLPSRAARFPYLTLGEAAGSDWSTDTEDGTEHRLSLHVWSRAPGRGEALEIGAAARRVLHDQALTLDGHVLVNLRFERADLGRDPDRLTWHGVLRFRAVTEPT